MKSIFSTQNLQTFILRKYWRLPRRGPPGPPPGPPSRRGPWPPPPGPPSRRGPPGPPPLGACDVLCSSAMTACLSNSVRNCFYVRARFGKRRYICATLAGGGLLCRRGRCGGATWTARGAGFALLPKLLLALEIFVDANGQIFDYNVEDAQAPLELRAQLGMRGRDL